MMNSDLPADYRKLVLMSRELTALRSARGLLSWDQETYMPGKALGYRAEQLASLGGRIHRVFTAPEVGEWIAGCEEEGFGADTVEAANVREWRWEYDRETKLPGEFVEDFTKTTALAMDGWQRARKASDFGVFQPYLEKIVALNRRKAEYFGYEACAYDALIDGYERGTTSGMLRGLFAAMRAELAGIGPAAWERSARIPADLLKGHYPVAAQAAFNREVAAAIGFDFEAGRIDTSAHPFCSGIAPGDTRLTTRYDESDFLSSLYGVLHECGHGLYEQGLPKDAEGLPVAEASSLGIHESQSRLWENHVGRGAAFWEHWFPRAAEHFPSLRALEPGDLARVVTRSGRSFIRVEADEVTYDLHVMLRFEIESRLMACELEVADVPSAWNAAFEEMFGLKVDNDARGCLQDIHWSMGAMGYFPTYSLGNLNASQLFHHARRQRPEIEAGLRVGEYGALLGWLREMIHLPGRRWLPGEIILRATGEPLNPSHHIAHLRERYTGEG